MNQPDEGLRPVQVDPRRFCRDSQVWESRSDVAAFPRLAQEFTQGELICRVEGRADSRGGLSLRLVVSGAVGTICQRCLKDMQYPIRVDRVVHLARNDAELERLDASPDSDAILASENLDLVDLVEDEVLLGLPLATMHAEGECPA